MNLSPEIDIKTPYFYIKRREANCVDVPRCQLLLIHVPYQQRVVVAEIADLISIILQTPLSLPMMPHFVSSCM